MLYGKETLILEEVTSTLLSNKIRKRINQEEKEGSNLVTNRKKRNRRRKVQLEHATFVIGKVIGRMTASISKSG